MASGLGLIEIIFMLVHTDLSGLASASYIVASTSKKILGLGLVLGFTVSGLGLGLGLMPSYPR